MTKTISGEEALRAIVTREGDMMELGDLFAKYAALIASQAARIRELETSIADIATRMDRQVKASDGYAEEYAKKDEARPTVWQIGNSHFTDLARELHSLLTPAGGTHETV